MSNHGKGTTAAPAQSGSVKVLATGDWHIDSDTHGGIDPATGMNKAWLSNAAACKSAVDHALANEVDVFIHAGDGFKTGRPSQEAVLMFAETLRPVVQAGIPVVLLGGNHDLITVPTAQRTATSTVAHILGQWGEVIAVEREPELVRTKSGIQIGCLPWLSKSTILTMLGLDRIAPDEGDLAVVDFALRALDEMYADADESAPFMLTSHVTVDDVRLDSISKGHKRGSEVDIAHLFAEPILPRKALEQGPASFVGLSHIHARQRIGTKCYYAGAPNRITFTDADDAKSVNLVEISSGNELLGVDYLETDARAMHSITLEDSGAEKALAALSRDALVRIVLPAGESMVPPEVRAAVADAGAVIADTQQTPLDRPRQSMVTLPEKINPVTALDTWLNEKEPDADHKYAVDLAARLVEEVG